MLKIRLTTKDKADTVIPPNQPTEGSGERAKLYPLLSVENIGIGWEQIEKTTLADPKSCPNIGDHFTVQSFYPGYLLRPLCKAFSKATGSQFKLETPGQ